MDPEVTPAVASDPAGINPDLSIVAEAEGAADPRPSEAESTAETEARRYGWVPREQWLAQGKPAERWNPASAFLDVRNNVLRITSGKLSQAEGRIAQLEAKLAERETQEKRFEAKLSLDGLRMKIREARAAGDDATADQLQEQLLDKQVEAGVNARLAAQTAAQPQLPPEFKQALAEWGAANPVVAADPRMLRQWGVELKVIMEARATNDPREAMEMATDKVKAIYPDKFRAPARPTMAMADVGGTGGMDPPGGYFTRSWSSLRPDVRKMAEADIRAGEYDQKTFLESCGAEHFQ